MASKESSIQPSAAANRVRRCSGVACRKSGIGPIGMRVAIVAAVPDGLPPFQAPASEVLVAGFQWNRRQEDWFLSCLAELLKCIGDLQQCSLAPGSAKEGHAHRQPIKITGRYVDVRVTGNSRAVRAASHGVVSIDEVREPRG